MVVEDTRQSARIWNNLTVISGGSLTLYKTSYGLLALEMARGELQLATATEEVIMMEDGKGIFVAIYSKRPDELNERLGYQICPDGKQDHAHEAIMKNMQELCGRISSALLLEKEGRKVLHKY